MLERVVYDDEGGRYERAVAGEALVGHTAPESLFSQDAGFRAAASRDEAGEDGDDEGFSGMDDGSAQEMLRQAMAQGFGVVDKIDFDEPHVRNGRRVAMMRLQKFLARAGVASRRHAEKNSSSPVALW